MSAAKLWTRSLLLDGLLAACVYFWLARDMDGAGNIFVTTHWFTAVLMILSGFVLDKTSPGVEPRPMGYTTYHHTTAIASFCVLAYTGHTTLALLHAIGHVMYEAARTRDPKAKEDGAA